MTFFADVADMEVTIVFRQHQPIVFAIAFVAFTATLASAQPRDLIRDEVTLRGTVEAIDRAGRTVRIRGDQGNVVTLDVPQSLTRFDQVAVGDIVTVSYHDRVNIRPKPADEPAVDRVEPATTTPAPGGLPGASVAAQRVTTVTITGWDPATRMVSFNGPTGSAYTRRLLDTTDASVMAGLKVGDRVDVTRTEALNLSVQTPPQTQVVAEESLRNRLTFSVLWGWENQFSGKIIEESTGATTGGAPINLGETTYDDVYGRMGIFRVGVGYRTTPRTEAIANFVYSRSGEERVTIGTVGVSNIPLDVDFTEFSYWGFEGGQRVYFARTRFTPFLGYLVGINRYGDIRGTFVGVPPEVTPGLAAQDGKFFEKSWALSLGPTAGVLIGVGPFELMAETQLRFMGGLSDVDWLVEEGLRDINSESSRWSIPISLGARFRF